MGLICHVMLERTKAEVSNDKLDEEYILNYLENQTDTCLKIYLLCYKEDTKGTYNNKYHTQIKGG